MSAGFLGPCTMHGADEFDMDFTLALGETQDVQSAPPMKPGTWNFTATLTSSSGLIGNLACITNGMFRISEFLGGLPPSEHTPICSFPCCPESGEFCCETSVDDHANYVFRFVPAGSSCPEDCTVDTPSVYAIGGSECSCPGAELSPLLGLVRDSGDCTGTYSITVHLHAVWTGP